MHKVFVNDETVPVEEFNGVIERLDAHNIKYTERKRLIGSLYQFGSTGAGCDLLVESEEEAERARQIIDDYQAELIDSSRHQYRENADANRTREWIGWTLAAVVIIVVLGLSLSIGF